MDRSIPAAPGIEYQEAHGLRFFRCAAKSATLTVKSCAESYRASKSALRVSFRPHLDHCVGCPIGAAHCGEKPRVRSSTFCPRCHRSDLRFIPSSGLCVSCYNRQGELKRGKNARGNLPKEILRKKPLKQRTVAFVHDGVPVRFRRLSVDHVEPMLAALLLAKKPESIMFTFGRGRGVGTVRARDWQRPNAVMARRALDRERRGESKRCGTS